MSNDTNTAKYTPFSRLAVGDRVLFMGAPVYIDAIGPVFDRTLGKRVVRLRDAKGTFEVEEFDTLGMKLA